MQQKKSLSSDKMEVSIASTMGRTFCLIGITLLFMAIVRFCQPISHIIQHIAGTASWQRLYDLLHIKGALGREQLILMAIVIVCFCSALVMQVIALWGWTRWRLASQRRK